MRLELSRKMTYDDFPEDEMASLLASFWTMLGVETDLWSEGRPPVRWSTRATPMLGLTASAGRGRPEWKLGGRMLDPALSLAVFGWLLEPARSWWPSTKSSPHSETSSSLSPVDTLGLRGLADLFR